MRALAIVALLAGCSQRTEVDVTLDLAAVGAERLGQIKDLVLEVRGDRNPFSTVIGITDQLASGEGRLVYLPGVSEGTIELRVDGRDATGLSVAAGTFTAVQVRPNQATSVRLVMQPNTPNLPDMSALVDMSPFVDMSVIDTGTTPDLLGGTSTCNALGAMVRFCEDFEGTLAAWNMFSPPPGGTIMLDGLQKARGAKALHYADPGVDMGGTRDFVIAHKTGFDWKPKYVRFFLYYAADTSSVGASVLTLSNGGGYLALGVQANGKVRLSTSGLGATEKSSATALPLNRWACFEVSAVPGGDGGLGALRVHLDDTELGDLRMDNADLTNNLGDLALGFAANYGPAVPAGDVWYDELIVDDKPIGCAK